MVEREGFQAIIQWMWKAWQSRFGTWLWNVLIVVVPIGATGLGLFLMHLSLGLPDVAALSTYEKAQQTRLLSRDGQLIATLFVEKRTPVTLDKVSPHLIQALLAVEDSRFYQHAGVDWWGIGRAFVANTVLGRVDQGASTLTMQLARHRFLSQDLSLTRKIREMMLAGRIEKSYSKEKILEYYLNNVYFGSGAYGVASASQLYFERPPHRLSLAQAALLAGLVQAPSQLSPLVHREAALRRMQVVLARMRATGAINEAQRAQALQEKIPVVGHPKSVEPLLKYPYFSTYVIAQLSRQLPEEQLYRGGLEVNTTLDVELQRWAEAALSQTMAAWGPAVQADSAALVLIENSTGAIRAMVGGRGWSQKNQFNRAWQAVRQPGSSFKPFVYAAALLDGLTPESLVEDSPVRLGDWSPKNSDGSFRGRITMRQALQESRNVVAARLCQQVGPERVVELAQAMGIREKLVPNLSIALGSCEVSPLSMAGAFSTLASGGYYRQPVAITRITSSLGQELQDKASRLVLPVLPQETCAQLVDMMISSVRFGTGRGAALPGVDVAGKTGTTDESRDAWFVGFTPEYTLACWVGNDDHSPMAQVYGGGLPATLWRRVMEKTLEKGTPKPHFAFLKRPPSTPRSLPPETKPPPEEPPPSPQEEIEEKILPPVEPWETPAASPPDPLPTESPSVEPEATVPDPVEPTPVVELTPLPEI
jgi:penicillin-binding protein 1A